MHILCQPQMASIDRAAARVPALKSPIFTIHQFSRAISAGAGLLAPPTGRVAAGLRETE